MSYQIRLKRAPPSRLPLPVGYVELGKQTRIIRIWYETSSYLATRLKKDHAELAAEVEAGRMKLRAAARAAGIIKPPDPVKELMR